MNSQMPEPDADEEVAGEDEQAAFDEMVAGLRAHIFGQAEESIRAKLRQSQDVTQDIGLMTLPLVMEAGKQAAGVGIEADFEMLSAVATEVIDDLLEVAEAMGVIDEITDDDRQEALLAAIMGYLSSADVPPEEQEAAKEQLRAMQGSPEVESTVQDIRRLGERRGIDPFASGEQVAPAQPMRMMQG